MPSRPNPRAPAFPFPKAPTPASAAIRPGDIRSTWSNKPTTPIIAASDSSSPTPAHTASSSPHKLAHSIGSIASSNSSFDMIKVSAALPSESDVSASGRSSASPAGKQENLAPIGTRWSSTTPYEFVPRSFTTPLNKQNQQAGEVDDATPKNSSSTTQRMDIPAPRFISALSQQIDTSASQASAEAARDSAFSMYSTDYAHVTDFPSGGDSFPQYPAQQQLFGGPLSQSATRLNSPPFPFLGHSYDIQHAIHSDDSNSTSDSSGNDFFHTYGQGYPHPLAFARVPPPAAPTGTLLHRQSAPDIGAQRQNPALRLNNPMMDQYGSMEDEEGRSHFGSGGASGLRGLGDTLGKRNVFIHQLPAGMNSMQLRNYAERFGEVIHVKLAGEDDRMGMEPVEGKRYAYVLMATHDQASQLLAALRSQGLACELAKEDWQTEYRAREDRNSSNVYVVGLPIEWSKDDVEDYMTQFGRVASLRLLEDKEGNRRGPILIRQVFDSRPQAERAIQGLNGIINPVSGERMQARVADSDGQKDYKRLRSTADSIPDERRPSMSTSEDVNMIMNVDQLLAIREKYERKLQMVNFQLTSLAPQHYRPPGSSQRLNGCIAGPGSRARPHLNIALATEDYRRRQMSHDWGTPPASTMYDPLASPLTPGGDILTPPPSLRHFSHDMGTPQSTASPSRHRTMSAHTAQSQAYASGQQATPERRFATVGHALGRSLVLPGANDAREKEQESGTGLWHTRSTSDLAAAQAKEEKAAKLLWPGCRM